MSKPKTTSRRVRFSVRDERVGLALIEMLTTGFPHYTRAEWEQRLRAGALLVNGHPGVPDQVLGAGDTLEYDAADIPEPEVSLAAEILHEDADILVINKPAGLPCHPAGRFYHHTLWALLTAKGIPNPEFVNRLDRETSGLVVVAKTPGAARACRREFERRRVDKRYVVLVEGQFPATQRACGRICRDPASPVHRKCRFTPEPEPAPANSGHPSARPGPDWADTEFRLQAQHGPISVVEAIPHTGRMHQIRATLEALGFPVVGDKLYGGSPELFLRFCHNRLTAADRQALRLPRQALHAAGLRFRHPVSGQFLTFRAELPADMRDLIAALDGTP